MTEPTNAAPPPALTGDRLTPAERMARTWGPGWVPLGPQSVRPEPLASVAFALTPDDLRAFDRYLHRRDSPSLGKRVLFLLPSIVSLVIPVLLVTRTVTVRRLGTRYPWLPYVAIASLLLLALVVRTLLERSGHAEAEREWRRSGVLESQTIWLTPGHLAGEGGGRNGVIGIPWSAVTDIRMAEGRQVYLAGQTAFCVVPDGAFASPDEAREFFDTATRLAEAARTGEPLVQSKP